MNNTKSLIVLFTILTTFVCLFFIQTCNAHGKHIKWNPPPIPQGVKANDVVYNIEGNQFTGYVAYPTEEEEQQHDNSYSSKKSSSRVGSSSGLLAPGIFIGHTWNGLGPMEKWRCQQMAAKGFVCFVPDLYGTGIRPQSDATAKAEMDKLLSNLTAFYYYLDYGMERLKSFNIVKVNQSALFANGYCLGGQMVLELARRGYPNLIGVSSFHGELGNLTSKANDKFNSDVSIAVHHADLDYQGFQALLNIENEFRQNNVTKWITTKLSPCLDSAFKCELQTIRSCPEPRLHEFFLLLNFKR